MKIHYLLPLSLFIAIVSYVLPGYHNYGVMVVFSVPSMERDFRSIRLENVDPFAFKDLGYGYAKDTKYVYYHGKVIANANAETFKVIGKIYAIDKAHVFYKDIVIREAEPATFSIMKEWGWSKDRKHIYAGDKSIETCDIGTFKFLTDDWQADSKCVYTSQKILQLADPNTFKVINFWYGKDKEHVFYHTHLIDGADANTFQLFPSLCVDCARDKNYCYRDAVVVNCE
jgi:hypothetical protein